MKKKTKRRYDTAQQICDEIQRYKDKEHSLLMQAEAYDLSARELIGISEMVEDAKVKKYHANKLRRSASRIADKKLPALKAKLAEFLTPQIPGLDNGDRSIPS